jgi:hypothetical protein
MFRKSIARMQGGAAVTADIAAGLARVARMNPCMVTRIDLGRMPGEWGSVMQAIQDADAPPARSRAVGSEAAVARRRGSHVEGPRVARPAGARRGREDLRGPLTHSDATRALAADGFVVRCRHRPGSLDPT